MAEYSKTDDGTATTVVERRRGPGFVIGIVLLTAVVIVGLLFATGFWKADVQGGSLPDVKVSAKGGDMPNVDLKSKEVVVGTKSTTVDVPKIETKKTKIDVPVVGVKDGDAK
jgi:hypothetical protein